MTTTFVLPEDLNATEPPEARGTGRDDVRLLVASPAGVAHARFADLADHLRPGDLLVVNTSATLAAAVDGTRAGGRAVTVHLSTDLGDGVWLVEVRPPGRATGPVGDVAPGERIALPAGAGLTVTAPFAAGQRRLWRARLELEGHPHEYLARHGRPISYAYVRGRWPLAAYQTVFAREPGSAEMPSAARPFTDALVTRLVTNGVRLAPVTLHTGVSSQEPGEPPLPERYRVPEPTADLVNHTRARGGRVVAAGTTVVRALESAAGADGTVEARDGWTDLVLGPDRPVRVAGGIVTGWHAPGASHLHLLEAVAGADVVRRAYDEALRHGYRWHEFGDSALLLR
ncbi:MAG TPA: S-adenosylmethionine:tRNA ribosyltransferase-isomerase [Mycobacteriales bacterium]|jgi:S-adenosylmethionine:tRNA ribosyltransferase-isomerase|nr:S-adenosylmethionine:tRNA ribosyltransferase-isomerase [Mycobacteriales bacterium]